MSQEKVDRNKRILEQWQTGRYKSYSALARIFRVTPKIVERLVKKRMQKQKENHGNDASLSE